MTANTKYGFYLANGSCVEYDLLPDSSIVEIISLLAYSCYEAGSSAPFQVWMQPKCISRLSKELVHTSAVLVRPLDDQTYPRIFRLETPMGSAIILAKPNLLIPIFIGSEREVEDNIFSARMDEILTSSGEL